MDIGTGWGRRGQGGMFQWGWGCTVEDAPCCSEEEAADGQGGMQGDSWGLQERCREERMGTWAWGLGIWRVRSMGGVGDDGAGSEETGRTKKVS